MRSARIVISVAWCLLCANAVASPPPARPTQPAGAPIVEPAPEDIKPGDFAPLPKEPEPTTHLERRRIKALWLTGLLVDLGLWAVRAGITGAICASYSSDARGCDGTDYLSAAVPVVGAWIDLAKGSDYGGLLVASGLLEAAGFAAFITGLIVKRDVEVDGPPDTALLVPMLRPGAAGVSLVGRF